MGQKILAVIVFILFSNEVLTSSNKKNRTIIKLRVGESVTLDVWAKKKWNNSKILIKKNQAYLFKVQGKWIDGYIKVDANGYHKGSMKLFEKYRRDPYHNWFALLGTIGQSSNHFFLIGHEYVLKSDSTGILYTFANDIGKMYWNNRGKVKLTIRRIKFKK